MDEENMRREVRHIKRQENDARTNGHDRLEWMET